jgi:hypothetical protein
MNPEHSEYCNCECPEGLSYSKLEETLNRVRMVHVKGLKGTTTICISCDNPYENDSFVLWPCETMIALAGDDL